MTPINSEGLLLVDKPTGVTSFGSLSAIKKKLKTKKVGHTGTLDRFASGLLVVVTGKLTKIASFIEAHDKRYEAFIQMGVETDTLDPEGEVIRRGQIPSLHQITEATADFNGVCQQIPPQYSALKINGKRASTRVRLGESVEIKPRTVEIKSLKIEDLYLFRIQSE